MLEKEDLLKVLLANYDLLFRPDPVPQHTSVRTGAMYFKELMETNNVRRFQNVGRMDRPCFQRLLHLLKSEGGLKETRGLCCGEKLMIFIHALVGSSVRQLAETWQHSYSTISSVIHAVSKSMISLKDKLFIKPSDTVIPDRIRESGKYSPYFNECIGALDGSYVPAVAPIDEQGAFRDRKGHISQNVLAVVNFDGTFSYVLAGWEGGACDGRVMQDAMGKGITLYPNRYYLADAGYALTLMTLTPYRGVRYHLKEWERGKRKPQNAKELYNLRHSSLRNIVERAFGIVKKRFPLLTAMHSYSFPMQIDLVMCCFMIHNFICLNQGYDDEFANWNAAVMEEDDHAEEPVYSNQSSAQQNAANIQRDVIAQEMWEDYVRFVN